MSTESEQELKGISGLREFLEADFEPEPAESAYRRGYADGYSRALQDLASAHRKGYTRPMHALAVLASFWGRSLYPWRLRGRASNPTEEWPPKIIIESWDAVRRKVFERDDYTCFYCRKSKKNHGVQIVCDHVEPVVAGGDNELYNLVAACKVCNRAKGKKPIHIFDWRAYMRWLGYDFE